MTYLQIFIKIRKRNILPPLLPPNHQPNHRHKENQMNKRKHHPTPIKSNFHSQRNSIKPNCEGEDLSRKVQNTRDFRRLQFITLENFSQIGQGKKEFEGMYVSGIGVTDCGDGLETVGRECFAHCGSDPVSSFLDTYPERNQTALFAS
jgi:hypothetical protein